jgi:hypothetical protein
VKVGALPQIKMTWLGPGSQGYSSQPILREPGTPMPIEEAIARLKNVLVECKTDYHYVPSKEDFEAPDRVCAALESTP